MRAARTAHLRGARHEKGAPNGLPATVSPEPSPSRRAQSAPASNADHLRAALRQGLQGLVDGSRPLHIGPGGDPSAPGAGHFHLAPELFLQLGGSTRFIFPQGELTLHTGEALLVPPTLRHHEQVRAGRRREPFRNLVLHAEGLALRCHLAQEVEPGRPGILHLEVSRHPEAAHVQGWLTDAARLGEGLSPVSGVASPKGDASEVTESEAAEHRPVTPADGLRQMQARTLVGTALAGVLRLLGPSLRPPPSEPPLVARLRVLVHNQLGDASLSVRALAQQSGCSADYLSHLFTRHAGEHLVAYITRLRLDRGEQLLRESALPIKAIAWACGYSTPGYFIRSFRGRHGVTPRSWRLAQRTSGS